MILIFADVRNADAIFSYECFLILLCKLLLIFGDCSALESANMNGSLCFFVFLNVSLCFFMLMFLFVNSC